MEEIILDFPADVTNGNIRLIPRLVKLLWLKISPSKTASTRYQLTMTTVGITQENYCKKFSNRTVRATSQDGTVLGNHEIRTHQLRVANEWKDIIDR